MPVAAPPLTDWPSDIFRILKRFDVRQIGYVPDGGHAALIRAIHADAAIRAVTLTTEEEGVALLAGAWLGGQRGALLMQSSGLGNCINMLSLVKTCRFPFLALITMRGEWGEFNPWQVPMGSASAATLRLMDVQVYQARTPGDVAGTVQAATAMAFEGGVASAVLLSQQLVGAKDFSKVDVPR
jgi:sulfopyruvate decarboxylase alpha subunit